MSTPPFRRLSRVGRSTRKVLDALHTAAPDELWGYEISTHTGLTGGSLYPVFRRLESAGIVEARWEGDEPDTDRAGPRRRFYRLTPDGLAYTRELLGIGRIGTVRTTTETS